MATMTSRVAFAMLLLPGLASASTMAFKVAPYSLTSASVDAADESLSLTDMESIHSVFSRTAEEHRRSMDHMAKNMTLPKAMEVFKSVANSTAAEDAALNIASLLGVTKTNLRKKQPSGYSGIDGARKMLNDMIFEAMEKYDKEIMKCTDYYAKQCALMEIARGEISAANFVAANSRALILDAQYNINKCEVAIPETKQELKEHNQKCADDLAKLRARLKIVMGDIAVMTMILKMTDCDAKFFTQKSKLFMESHKLIMLKCKDRCSNKETVSFNHKGLQQLVSQLQTPTSIDLLQTSFKDMFDENAHFDTISFVQDSDSNYQEPIRNITKFNNPPVPRTKIPGNPCDDPYQGAPSAADKRAAKCTIKKSPQCYKLQSRFLAIQGGIADERDSLLEEIEELELACEEQKKTLESIIKQDQDLLSASQTKLAVATEKESSAGEEARQTALQNEQYETDLRAQMKACSTNYIQSETELCALKKIRGELYKLKGSGHSAFFQDCEVSKWDPEECTKECGGGTQKLKRSVLTPRKGGTKCLYLAAIKKCNRQPCPVDCRLDVWTGWSKCSAKCGGGVTQRLRDVKLAMKFNGKPCSSVSETKACNIEACEKDCELSAWTKWTACSKDCDGGTKKRQKFVVHPAEGEGKCADEWSEARLEYEPCNLKVCKLPNNTKTLTCNKTMDVTILIDECPRSGEEGFKSQIESANNLVDAFTDESKPEFAIIKYCGPRTWSGVSKCTESSGDVDTEGLCRTKVVQHFDEDKRKAHNLLNGLDFAKGTKLTALALLAAKAELTLGRKNAHATVVVFQDGQPLSFRKTRLAAHDLRKKARLLWVVVSKFSPLKDVKKWATRRWQENLIDVKSDKEMGEPATVTKIIANICPKKFPKLKMNEMELELAQTQSKSK